MFNQKFPIKAPKAPFFKKKTPPVPPKNPVVTSTTPELKKTKIKKVKEAGDTNLWDKIKAKVKKHPYLFAVLVSFILLIALLVWLFAIPISQIP